MGDPPVPADSVISPITFAQVSCSTRTMPNSSIQAMRMKTTRLIRYVVLLVLGLFPAAPLRAADIVWTNGNSSVWSAVTNWSPRQVPGPADNAYITNSGTYTVTLD